MTKFTLSFAALAALTLVAADANPARAGHPFPGFGLHFGGRNVHFDVGNPHGNAYRQPAPYRAVPPYYPPQHYAAYRGGYHYDWHDTSHYDYHPPQIVRHGNHFDYLEGHYDFHPEGHYDPHRGGHGNGHHGRHH
jgi:hypothetical protein